jgi:hypothetical protein
MRKPEIEHIRREHEIALDEAMRGSAESMPEELAFQHEELMVFHNERHQFHGLLARRKYDSVEHLNDVVEELDGQVPPGAAEIPDDLVEIRPGSRMDEAWRRHVTAI